MIAPHELKADSLVEYRRGPWGCRREYDFDFRRRTPHSAATRQRGADRLTRLVSPSRRRRNRAGTRGASMGPEARCAWRAQAGRSKPGLEVVEQRQPERPGPTRGRPPGRHRHLTEVVHWNARCTKRCMRSWRRRRPIRPRRDIDRAWGSISAVAPIASGKKARGGLLWWTRTRLQPTR